MNLLTLREKGMNQTWPNAISANTSQGAPCYYSNPAVPPDFPGNQVPASFQVTQTNGMGLTAPNGQNCTVRSFVTGRCLQALVDQYRSSAGSGTRPARSRPARSSGCEMAAKGVAEPAGPDRPPGL